MQLTTKVTEQDVLEVVDDFSRSIFEVSGIKVSNPYVTNEGVARVQISNNYGAHVVAKFYAGYAGVQYDLDGRDSDLLNIVLDFAKDVVRRKVEKMRGKEEACLELSLNKYPSKASNEIADEIINDLMVVYGCASVFNQEFLNYLKQRIAQELRKKNSQISELRRKVEAMARAKAKI